MTTARSKQTGEAGMTDELGPDGTLHGTEITPVPDDLVPHFTREQLSEGDPYRDTRDPQLYKEVTDRAKQAYTRTIEDSAIFGEQDLPPLTGTIDVAAFVKAQAEFLRRQTFFLQHRGTPGTEEYGYNLTQYSLAQAAFIAAQAEVLRQVGVI